MYYTLLPFTRRHAVMFHRCLQLKILFINIQLINISYFIRYYISANHLSLWIQELFIIITKYF